MASKRKPTPLLPCPFCGGKAVVWVHWDTVLYYAQCSKCKVRPPQDYTRKRAAVRRWNTRKEPRA